MVSIEIDGIKIEAKDGAMVIEAADEVGISIPRFCYHKKLSVAANCRMCLVEVEKAVKPLPACATPVTEGMIVHTKSPKAIEAQKGVMEFLLINHPLDCPICDQGGECDLQDLAVGYGASHSRFQEKKRVVKDKNLGPLIATDMTRCIHCTRCVRFGEEIAGIKELGATGRSEHMEIGTYVESAITSEMSGNVIDLCPVGALTSKPFRYSARNWEMQTWPSIAPHDCVGSNITLEVRNNKVMRVVPRENEAINETWLSDRDRFSYQGLNSSERLQQPMIKKDGQWQQATWDTALAFAVNGLKDLINGHGADQLGGLVSPSATVEEMFLLQKLVRGTGCVNIDHRLRQLDFSDDEIAPLFPSLGQSVENLEKLDAALLIGSNIRKDQPIAGHRLRKAALAGAKISFINPVDYDFNFPVAGKIVTAPAGMEVALGGVVKALLTQTRKTAPAGIDKLLKGVEVTGAHSAIATQLREAQNGTVLLGQGGMSHPAFATLRALAGAIAELTTAKVGYLTLGSNAAGAWLAGALPHRGAAGAEVSGGLNAREMLASPLKGYVLMGVEPECDGIDPLSAIKALREAEFVVSLSAYNSDTIASYADVVLPIGPFSETSGTFVNAEGRWQSFAAAVAPLGNARPAWKVLRVLGNLLDIAGFDYMSSEEVRDELQQRVGDTALDNTVPWRCPEEFSVAEEVLRGVDELPSYGVDSITRRSDALQQTLDATSKEAIKIGLSLASRLGLENAERVVARQGDNEVTLSLVVDRAIPDGVVVVPGAIEGSERLRSGSEPIELRHP